MKKTFEVRFLLADGSDAWFGVFFSWEDARNAAKRLRQSGVYEGKEVNRRSVRVAYSH